MDHQADVPVSVLRKAASSASSAALTVYSALMERRPALLRAMVLLDTYTIDLTRAACGVLGEGKTANARVVLLLTVHQNPQITPTALAAALRRNPTSVARELSKLADDGIVSFAPDASDRRVRHIALTRRGRAQVTALVRACQDVFASSAPLVKEAVDVLQPAGPQPHPAPPVLDILNAMARVGARFSGDAQAALEPFGLTTSTERFALLLIADRPNARPSTLVDELRLSTAAASEVITRLEESGLVRRASGDEGDRRHVHVRLTQEGRGAVTALLDVMERHTDEVAAALVGTTG